ncbi:MAG: phosphoglucosamine mutase [Saprospiraceae bacterium]
MLNEKGEFISANDGANLLALLAEGSIEYASIDELGTVTTNHDMVDYHVAQVLAHPLVDVAAIQAQQYKVVIDAVNSTGALALPPLLEALGCQVSVINGEMHGHFAHNPEPLPAHLEELCQTVQHQAADMGISVDPDVDRLALVGPGGTWIGEEYTLVITADYVLRHTPGPVVSNLSSTRALRDIAHRHGQSYHASAVGEVNVVEKMKAVNAVLGGEGNGGIIDPALHYGRDALVGVALILSSMATTARDLNALRADCPEYHMVKDKVVLSPTLDVEAKLAFIQQKYKDQATINTIDGLKLDFPAGWVHLRRSNTEPIVRIYAEAGSPEQVQSLVDRVKGDFV